MDNPFLALWAKLDEADTLAAELIRHCNDTEEYKSLAHAVSGIKALIDAPKERASIVMKTALMIDERMALGRDGAPVPDK